MYEALNQILAIQEYDMQMIQLIRLKRERQKELNHINSIRTDLKHKTMIKEGEIIELKKNMRITEGEAKEIAERIKKLEGQQDQVKKVDEFNALSHEISRAQRERTTRGQLVSDLQDKVVAEEEILKTFTDNMKSTSESSQILETEIHESVTRINEEGRDIKSKRDLLVDKANPDVFRIYEGLLKNKKDRVIVSIENRCCSGCHIMLTAQHENLVRKGELLVFCEHCSRIHFWEESEALEGTPVTVKQRRRRRTTKT